MCDELKIEQYPHFTLGFGLFEETIPELQCKDEHCGKATNRNTRRISFYYCQCMWCKADRHSAPHFCLNRFVSNHNPTLGSQSLRKDSGKAKDPWVQIGDCGSWLLPAMPFHDSFNTAIYRASASCHEGSFSNPFSVSLPLSMRLFAGRFAFAPYSSVVTGTTLTSAPASLKILQANSYQEQIPSFVA